MPNLILLRHGQSQWNLENRFTGWIDIDLSPMGEEEARSAGRKLRGLSIDKVYTSVLKRAIRTATIALEEAGRRDLQPIEDQALNERHYGDLQGLNKAETAEKYGAEQVHIWRRSFDVRPPGDEGESLEMTIARVIPYFKTHIVPDLQNALDVLVVAHGNSLRALSYVLDNHTRSSIMELNIPTGVPIIYDVAVDDDRDVMVNAKKELLDEVGAN